MDADSRYAYLGRLGIYITVEQQRLAGSDYLRSKALTEGNGFQVLAMVIGEAYDAFHLVQHGHIGDISSECVPDLLAY